MPFSAKSLGAALRLVREEAHLQGRQLADASGVAPSQLSEIETGKRAASTGFLEKIAPALNMKTWQLQQRIEELAAVIEGRTTESEANVLREESLPVSGRTTGVSPSENYSAMGPGRKEYSDHEALSRHLCAEIPRDRIFEMIHEFTKKAAEGDRNAAKCARALLDIITPP